MPQLIMSAKATYSYVKFGANPYRGILWK